MQEEKNHLIDEETSSPFGDVDSVAEASRLVIELAVERVAVGDLTEAALQRLIENQTAAESAPRTGEETA